MFLKSSIAGARDTIPGWLLLATGLLAILAFGLALPSGLVFALGVAAVVGVGALVAELRRHGGRGVPALPVVLED